MHPTSFQKNIYLAVLILPNSLAPTVKPPSTSFSLRGPLLSQSWASQILTNLGQARNLFFREDGGGGDRGSRKGGRERRGGRSGRKENELTLNC